MKFLLVAGLLAVVLPVLRGADAWPQLRGPNGLGSSDETSLPTKLGSESLAWSVDLPGPGSSSPVVWRDRLFITAKGAKSGEVTLHCLNAKSGKREWSRSVTTGKYRVHRMNNVASASPVVTGKAVAFSWFDAEREVVMLSGFDHSGSALWTHEVGSFKGQHGPSLPLTVHGDRILYAHLHQAGGRVASVEAATGKLVWSKAYPGESKKTAYSAPFVRQRLGSSVPELEVVVTSTATGVRGLDYETGEEEWSLPGVFKERCIVSPVEVLAGSGARDSLLTVGCKGNVFFAVRPPDARQGGQPEIAWRIAKGGPYVPTPVSNGKTLFVLSDGGALQALDAMTGKAQWLERLPGNFYASPLLIGTKLYCLTREGEMMVADVSDGFRLLATSDLQPADDVDFTDATPAVADGSLFVRLGARVDCYRR